MLEKIPPHNVELEMCLLGCILLDEDVFDKINVARLKAEDLYKVQNQQLFTVLQEMYSSKISIDLVSLRTELTKRELLEKVGGVEYLIELEEVVPTAGYVEYYIKELKDLSVKRQFIGLGMSLYSQGATANTKDLITTAETVLSQIAESALSWQPIKVFKEIITNAYDEIKNIVESGKRTQGVLTGFYEIDEITCGLQNGTLTIVAARPSMGKTSFALNIIEHAAANQIPSLFFSLETSTSQVAKSILCSKAGVNAHTLRKLQLQDKDWSLLTNGISMIYEHPIYIDDTAPISVSDICAKARALKKKSGVGLIVIDYLQLITTTTKKDNREQQVAEMSRSLKLLAKELDIPIILISQLNRSAEHREDRRPRLSDLRESGAIEQDADLIFLLYRDAYYSKTDNNIAEIEVAKQRYGPTGTVKLQWVKEFVRFENLGYGGIHG